MGAAASALGEAPVPEALTRPKRIAAGAAPRLDFERLAHLIRQRKLAPCWEGCDGDARAGDAQVRARLQARSVQNAGCGGAARAACCCRPKRTAPRQPPSCPQLQAPDTLVHGSMRALCQTPAL